MCDPVGSTDGNCDIESGQCNCKNFVTGRQCNQCQLGYYDLDSEGCKGMTLKQFVAYILYSYTIDCACSVVGSNSSQCLDDGTCICREGVMGDKCDQCMENFYLEKDSMACTSR